MFRGAESIGTAVHFMIAEASSDVFRLLDTRDVNEHDRNYQSVYLAAYAADNSMASGVWTNVSRRAERLTGPAVEMAVSRASPPAAQILDPAQ